MKKLLTALTALALVLSFAACGKQETPVQTTNDTTTAATTEVTTEAATEATTEIRLQAKKQPVPRRSKSS